MTETARAARSASFKVADLAPGTVRALDVDGMSIAVVRRRDGTFSALLNRCPHQAAPLAEGKCDAFLEGPDVGQYEVTDKDVLRCPWHHYEFDLDTGRAIADPDKLRVRVFKTRVEGDDLIVER